MSEENPWKRLGSRIVYQNPWITVREDQVIRPDGEEGLYGVVETRTAVGIVALNEKGEIYLVGQYRYPLNEYSWEIIEGGSDPGEDALQTAQRELREEAGLIASRWTPLGKELHLSNCHSSEVGVLFLAEGLSITEAEPDGTEVLQLKSVPFEEAYRMVEAGEIKDSLSIIGIYRAASFLQAARKQD